MTEKRVVVSPCSDTARLLTTLSLRGLEAGRR